jgi:formylglycine-generating enzyme required for sulfatase activity
MPGFHAWNGYKFSQCGLEKPTIEWVYIPGGTFTMGSPTGEVSREADETQHQITVSAFKMSKYTITVAKFKAFVDAKG